MGEDGKRVSWVGCAVIYNRLGEDVPTQRLLFLAATSSPPSSSAGSRPPFRPTRTCGSWPRGW
jgi:hypothetical protein